MIIEPTDYKSDKIKGKQRIYGGKFGNALEGVPWISFDEELITLDPTTGAVFNNHLGTIIADMSDPTKLVTMRNPLDDSVIGASTYQEAMIMLYSLGRQMQTDRDAAVV